MSELNNPASDISAENKPFVPELANCYFRISHYTHDLGTVEFKLYDDITPNTCRNFRKLCTGEKRMPNLSRPLHYLKTSFHRIVGGFMVQGGDITVGNGTGGYSIFGQYFPDENFIKKHDRPYLLSMANRGPNTNNSQFFITTNPCPHLDGKHVVFGEVVKGFEAIDYMDDVAVSAKTNKPYFPVIIDECGIVRPQRTPFPSIKPNSPIAKFQNTQAKPSVKTTTSANADSEFADVL